MAEYMREVTFAGVAAVVVVLVLATAVMYLPAGLGTTTGAQTPGQTSTSSIQTTTGPVLETTITTYNSPPVVTTTYSGCPALQPIDEDKVLGTVLNSSEVAQYTKTSFSYNWWYESRESCTSELPPIVEVNITGSQSISGNWTSQYVVTYSNNTMISAEVSFSYQITSLNVTRLPDQTQTLSYTAQQQQVIQVALTNSTVRGLTSGITYYISWFYHFGAPGNQTYAYDYYVVVDQVNGPLSLGIYINSNATQVIGVFQYHDCRYNNWNGTSCIP